MNCLRVPAAIEQVDDPHLTDGRVSTFPAFLLDWPLLKRLNVKVLGPILSRVSQI